VARCTEIGMCGTHYLYARAARRVLGRIGPGVTVVAIRNMAGRTAPVDWTRAETDLALALTLSSGFKSTFGYFTI
jgi:hypothetical protein